MVPEFRGGRPSDGDYTGLAAVTDVVNHLFLPGLTLTLAYLGEYYLVMRSSLLDVLGEEYITIARAKGLREKGVLHARGAQRTAADGHVDRAVVRVRPRRRDHGRGGVRLPGGGPTYAGDAGPDFPLLERLFLFSRHGDLANLVADLIYGYFDPRVRSA